MSEEGGLKDEIKKLNENFEQLLQSGKVKGVRNPKKVGRFQKKKNYVTVIRLGENKSMNIMKLPIEEGTVSVEGCPRIATPDYVFDWKGSPTLIIPEWSVEPFSPVQNYEETVRDKMTSAGWRLMINAAEQGKIKPKKKLSGGVIFIIVIVLLVIGYLLFRKKG